MHALLLTLALALAATPDVRSKHPEPARPPPQGLDLPVLLGEQPDPYGAAPQWLAAVGREDLRPVDPLPTCQPSSREPVAAIVERAKHSRVVIINEAHDEPRGRAFILAVATALAPLGFHDFAAEAFMTTPGATPWAVAADGVYVSEPTYGALVRGLKQQGFRLHAYDVPASSLDVREAQQAQALATLLASKPGLKLLVHVGYSHNLEAPVDRQGQRVEWMAARLKRQTGLDPLTVDQTEYRTTTANDVLCERPADATPRDLFVAHPALRLVSGRPAWRFEGAKAVEVPAALAPKTAPVIIEVRNANEPIDATPVDRLLLRPGDTNALVLPAGRYAAAAWSRAAGWSADVPIVVQ